MDYNGNMTNVHSLKAPAGWEGLIFTDGEEAKDRKGLCITIQSIKGIMKDTSCVFLQRWVYVRELKTKGLV